MPSSRRLASGRVALQRDPSDFHHRLPGDPTHRVRLNIPSARYLSAWAAALLLAGCASLEVTPDFFGDLAKHPESGAVLTGIPDPLLRGSMKGSDALAAVLTFWKRPADPNAIAAAVSSEYGGREREEALMLLADRKGMWTHATYGNLAALQTRVAHGVPVIVELVEDPSYPQNRIFAVVVGYDAKEKRVLCHEGRGTPRVYTDAKFSERWMPVRSWMLLVAPADRLTWDMSPAELMTRARFYESRNQLDLALKDLSSAMAKDPVNSRICVSAANLYRKLDRPDQAEGLYRRAIDLNPHEGQAFNNLAYLKAERGEDLAEAESLARKALLLEPTNPISLDTLGFILQRAGRLDEAVASLEQAYARSRILTAPRQREIAVHLARAYALAGRTAEAADILRQLRASDPSFVTPDDLRPALSQP